MKSLCGPRHSSRTAGRARSRLRGTSPPPLHLILFDYWISLRAVSASRSPDATACHQRVVCSFARVSPFRSPHSGFSRAAEALPWLERALGLDPANARASLYRGMAYYFLGRYGEAVEAMGSRPRRQSRAQYPSHGTDRLGGRLRRWIGPRTPRARNAALQLSPFLDAARFASQFGTQQARDHMLQGLKKAGFR